MSQPSAEINRTVVVSQEEAHAIFMMLHGVAKRDIILPPFRPEIIQVLASGELESRFLAAAFAEEGERPNDGSTGICAIDKKWADEWEHWAIEQPPPPGLALVHDAEGTDNDNADE